MRRFISREQRELGKANVIDNVVKDLVLRVKDLQDSREGLKKAKRSDLAAQIARVKGRLNAVIEELEGLISEKKAYTKFASKTKQQQNRIRKIIDELEDTMLEIMDSREKLQGKGAALQRRKLSSIEDGIDSVIEVLQLPQDREQNWRPVRTPISSIRSWPK